MEVGLGIRRRMMQVYIVGLTLLAVTLAFPSSTSHQAHQRAFLGSSKLQPRGDKPFALRVLPLGASITTGYRSEDENGYRIYLRKQLRYAGWEVNMVGSRKDGTMKDRDNEGWVGKRIEEVATYAERTIPKAPNLILINAGTNDALQNFDVPNAGVRMNQMLTRLYDTIPGTTIILSTLLPNNNEKAQANSVIINEQYRNIVAARQKNNDRIVLAEMSDYIKHTDLLPDGTHPTGPGYEKMASVWWAAIQEAESKELLQKPKDIGENDWADTTFEKEYGSGNSGDGKVQTQRGSGWDDGDYKHNSVAMGQIMQIGITDKEDDVHPGIHYAQLVNQGGAHREGALDELVWTRDGKGTFMFPNNNNGKFGAPVEIDVKDGCLARGVHWGDLNNDGLDDFICISREGAIAAPGGDLAQTNVRLGDIDGDGRIDYCLVKGNGDIQCWRNGGQKDAPTNEFGGYWQDLGIVFTGKGMGDIDGVRLVDINGDFRADWLWLDDEGKVTTYINQRGTGKGSLAPDWRRIGITHAGMGVKGARDRIKFGQIWPGGGVDYSWIESMENKPTWNHYTHVWKNVGKGGTTLKGDGDFYCDWRGTGADDYIWISPNGRGLLYGNVHKPPTWVPEGPQIFDLGRERKGIHLADFDGDGKCDVWAVNRETGAAEVWINHWNEEIGSGFLDYKGFVTGDVRCTEGWGVGLFDIGVSMADLDGDGRADYLCMEPDGRTVGWLNRGVNDFEAKGQVKRTQGYDRANHKWADVNGDGAVDFLWVDKFNGDTQVWVNMGDTPTAGSSWKWELLDGPRYQGSDRGANLYFPNIGGLSRADMHNIIPRTNIAYTWFNTCPGSDSSAVDDVDPSTNPNLPAYIAPDQPIATGTVPIPTPTPKPTDATPDGYYEHWPVDDDSLNHRICNDLGYPTKKLWGETDAGNWLVTTAGWYQKLALSNDFKWEGSIVQTFASFKGTKKEDDASQKKYIWNCPNLSNNCEIENLDEQLKCEDGNVYRVQALHAMLNLAQYFVLIKNRMELAWGSMSFKTAGLVTKYSKTSDEETSFGADSGATIGAGLASIFGAFMLGPMAGIAGGAMTIGAGAVGSLASVNQAMLEFSTYAELGDKASDIMDGTFQGLGSFFDEYFHQVPPADASWVTQPTSIPRILLTGNFASSDILRETSASVPPAADLKKFIAAPLINMLWAKDKIFILRIDNTSIKEDYYAKNRKRYHPCDENGDFEPDADLTDMLWCNPDGSAFLFMQVSEVYSKKLIRPKGIENLHADYGFNAYDIARSAYLVARTSNEWMAKVKTDSYFNWVPQRSGPDIPTWQMMRWNLPVCDMVDGLAQPSGGCTPGYAWTHCIYSLMALSCGFTPGWPKDYTYNSAYGEPGEGRPYTNALSPAEAVSAIGG
ncbi:hypothetical protein N7460_000640 [Penicillium canescens]|uniref:SGNH hydrolase-type esterase domain-containing protein n=1 Tax=Penicillium canescens TaxID=5083 RepID=A0AAD6INK0_PENCN|nr:hypothetical protein N7460_000640 [Penicillium canescens]